VEYPETAQIFWAPPIISGTGKATNFKFCTHIYRLKRGSNSTKLQKLHTFSAIISWSVTVCLYCAPVTVYNCDSVTLISVLVILIIIIKDHLKKEK